jgi:dienelactone hydrolase
MPQETPAPGDPLAYSKFIQAQGAALRAKDTPPKTLAEWTQRRKPLRDSMLAAMGTYDGPAAPLEAKEVGVLKGSGYRIEKLLLTTLPGVQATCSLYVPEPLQGKVPAVLVVHGHWPWARRDEVVQARCLGLVKLGFVVLAIDAFGAGERHPEPGRGAYHGALLGSTLWPAGWTLLGVQVHENRRALDYLQSRPEVDPKRLGVTGASGGGNQSMNVGAVDDRLGCVVPVCSVGTYQAYLRAACCVCEVLPGALRFTEEGDILGLVAPRALLVINATKDGFQFSVGEAKKSVERATDIFRLVGAGNKITHATFEAGHGYDQAMRETMYGFMTRWLKEEGEGKPIPEPRFVTETVENLACFKPGDRPATYVFPATLARSTANRTLDTLGKVKLDHREAWEATATTLRAALKKALGELPARGRPVARLGKVEVDGEIRAQPFDLSPEPGLTLPGINRFKAGVRAPQMVCLVLHLDGRQEVLKQPLTTELVNEGGNVLAFDLRATGENKPAGDNVGAAKDHNSAEHGLWIGRPLLGQWVQDIACVLDWVELQPASGRAGVLVVGYGLAGLVALAAANALPERITGVCCSEMPITLLTDKAYPDSVRMGLLAPSLLLAGDVPHEAALAAPRRLLINGGTDLEGGARTERQLHEAYRFTEAVYAMLKINERLRVQEPAPARDTARWLLGGTGR